MDPTRAVSSTYAHEMAVRRGVGLRIVDAPHGIAMLSPARQHVPPGRRCPESIFGSISECDLEAPRNAVRRIDVFQFRHS